MGCPYFVLLTINFSLCVPVKSHINVCTCELLTYHSHNSQYANVHHISFLTMVKYEENKIIITSSSHSKLSRL